MATGAKLWVRAHDPFGVVSVWVLLLGEAKRLLKEGEAEATGEGRWQDTGAIDHPADAIWQVRALAFDRPGNEAIYTLRLQQSSE